MVGTEKNNKKIGFTKILAGSSISVAGAVFYEFILPISMISTAVGLVSNLSGRLMKTVSKKESKLDTFSFTLQLVGAKMMRAGIVGITSPISGAMYAIDGGYSIYTGKESNIINNVNNFMLEAVVGSKNQEQKSFSINNSNLHNNSIDSNSHVEDIKNQTPSIPMHVTKAALKAAEAARISGVELTSESVKSPKFLDRKKKERRDRS